MAISHADHDHPNTPAARAACRKQMAKGDTPSGMTLDLRNGGVKMTVVPRKRGDGGVVKGMKAAAPKKDLKRPGTQIRTIGDLPDVPRMLAYACRLAWSVEWPVTVGERFNESEARLEVRGMLATISLVWRDNRPDGIWAVFVRNHNSSVQFRLDNIQLAFEVAMTEAAWDAHGNYIG